MPVVHRLMRLGHADHKVPETFKIQLAQCRIATEFALEQRLRIDIRAKRRFRLPRERTDERH